MNAQTGITIPGTEKADSLIRRFMISWNIKGGSVAVTKNGRLIYNKGFGYADAANTIEAQPNNLYRVASVSKPITAVAIMKLVEEDRLSLSDTVFGKNKILGQPYYLGVINDKRLYSVTIQQLLEHTAGWDRNVPVDGYPHSDPAFFPLHVSSVMKEPNPVGDSTLIKFMLLKGLNNSPGTHFSYSNVGYLVLGKVIEKISGMSYEKYVTEKILRPLGIYDMHLGKNLPKDKQEREADYFCDASTRSCYGDGSLVKNQYGGFNLEAMNAHGGWIASAPDLTKLLLAIDGKGADILKSSTLELMNTPGKANSNYAKGWFTNKKHNFWHTGSIDGSASFVCHTADGYTWAFLFNSRGDNSDNFWNAFDKLPKQCINAMNSPDVNLFAPEKNVSALRFQPVRASSIISWNNGNGNGRLVIASDDSLLTSFPLDGSSYTSGSSIGSKAVVVFNGTENRFMLKPSLSSTKYYLHVFEYFKNTDTNNLEVYKLAGSPVVAIKPRSEFKSANKAFVKAGK